MFLQKLQLFNFKNYTEASLDFSGKINVLVGKNGSGKTNLLDAVHILSLTKSAFTSDNFCIRHDARFFTIKGSFRNGNQVSDLQCSVQPGTKKIFREDANEYQKLSDHVGKYPVVLIAPDDTDLVKEGSDARRKFFDSIISQLHRPYLEALIRYTHTLRQRNSLLKMMAEKNSVDPLMLESYDQVLEQTGHLIFEMRKEFIQTFLPVFRHFYRFIVADEEAGLEYRSELERISFLEGLAKNRQRDILLQRTNFGIHRDEYSFSLAQGDLKRLGSQGQQKSFIIALKLAHAEIVRTQKNISPILLLDDIFDKLDDFRIARLLELIRNDSLGQLFITDARPERTVDLLRNIGVPATIFTVQNGSIEQP